MFQLWALILAPLSRRLNATPLHALQTNLPTYLISSAVMLHVGNTIFRVFFLSLKLITDTILVYKYHYSIPKPSITALDISQNMLKVVISLFSFFMSLLKYLSPCPTGRPLGSLLRNFLITNLGIIFAFLLCFI